MILHGALEWFEEMRSEVRKTKGKYPSNPFSQRYVYPDLGCLIRTTATIKMFYLILLPYFSTLVLAKPITQSSQSSSLRTSLGDIRSQAQSPQVCSQGDRSLVVDAEKRSQTLQWNIGSIEAIATPIQCEVCNDVYILLPLINDGLDDSLDRI